MGGGISLKKLCVSLSHAFPALHSPPDSGQDEDAHSHSVPFRHVSRISRVLHGKWARALQSKKVRVRRSDAHLRVQQQQAVLGFSSWTERERLTFTEGSRLLLAGT